MALIPALCLLQFIIIYPVIIMAGLLILSATTYYYICRYALRNHRHSIRAIRLHNNTIQANLTDKSQWQSTILAACLTQDWIVITVASNREKIIIGPDSADIAEYRAIRREMLLQGD